MAHSDRSIYGPGCRFSIFQSVRTIATNNSPNGDGVQGSSWHGTGRYLAVRHNIATTNEVRTRSGHPAQPTDFREERREFTTTTISPLPSSKFIAANSLQFSSSNPNFSSCRIPNCLTHSNPHVCSDYGSVPTSLLSRDIDVLFVMKRNYDNIFFHCSAMWNIDEE